MVQIVALNLKFPFLNSVSLTLTDLHLNEVGFLRQCPWQHPWVTEAGSEQHGHYEDEEQHCKHRDGRGQVHCQVWAPVQDENKQGYKRWQGEHEINSTEVKWAYKAKQLYL